MPHSIQLAARLTGLSPIAIRIWEQRYRAVTPTRTASKRRVYSAKEIERLRLLRGVTPAGHTTGQVAQPSDDKLRVLVQAAPGGKQEAVSLGDPEARVEDLQQDCLAAIRNFDGADLERLFRKTNSLIGIACIGPRMH